MRGQLPHEEELLAVREFMTLQKAWQFGCY